MTSGRSETVAVLRCLRQGLVFLVLVLVCRSAAAQAPVTFQYFYDSRGQLWKVVDSTGNVVEYIYDAVGNILEIRRSRAEGLAILGLTPNVGAPGTMVTIRGQGFAPVPVENIVRFNGTPEAVSVATATALTTTVSGAATMGPATLMILVNTDARGVPFSVRALAAARTVHEVSGREAVESLRPDLRKPTVVTVSRRSMRLTNKPPCRAKMPGRIDQAGHVVLA